MKSTSSSSRVSLNTSLIDSSVSNPNTLNKEVIGNFLDLLILATMLPVFSTLTSSQGPFSGINLNEYQKSFFP
jgi:hypothetical protein